MLPVCSALRVRHDRPWTTFCLLHTNVCCTFCTLLFHFGACFASCCHSGNSLVVFQLLSLLCHALCNLFVTRLAGFSVDCLRTCCLLTAVDKS